MPDDLSLLEKLTALGGELPESHKPATGDVAGIVGALVYYLETGTTEYVEPTAPGGVEPSAGDVPATPPSADAPTGERVATETEIAQNERISQLEDELARVKAGGASAPPSAEPPSI
jgi:hypothetical protein